MRLLYGSSIVKGGNSSRLVVAHRRTHVHAQGGGIAPATPLCESDTSGGRRGPQYLGQRAVGVVLCAHRLVGGGGRTPVCAAVAPTHLARSYAADGALARGALAARRAAPTRLGAQNSGRVRAHHVALH